jgi:predicted amidohydrolase
MLKLLVAQINCVVGDVSSNAEKILSIVEQAKLDDVDLVITPELSLCGYPPEDLLLRPDFTKDCDSKLSPTRSKNHRNNRNHRSST